MIKFKSKSKLQRNNIYLGIVKINNSNIKKIIYTADSFNAIDLFDKTNYPTFETQKNIPYVEEQVKIDELLKFLKYPKIINKRYLKKLRKLIYDDNSTIFNLQSKNKVLNKQIFHTMYYKTFFRNLK